MPIDYQKFFELQEKYPEKCSLIADIMACAFKNHNTLPDHYIYLNDSYPEEDITLILGELNIQVTCILQCPSRSIALKGIWYK